MIQRIFFSLAIIFFILFTLSCDENILSIMDCGFCEDLSANVYIINPTTIKIEFSHYCEEYTMLNQNNYTLVDEANNEVRLLSTEIELLEGYENLSPKIVKLTVEALKSEENYTLNIRNILAYGKKELPNNGLFYTIQWNPDEIIFDNTPPNYIFPGNHYESIHDEITFIWSKRIGASNYFLEIATDSDFTNPIEGSPFETTESSYSLMFTTHQTFYWRVKSDITEAGVYSNYMGEYFQFTTFGDSLYVYCPDNIECSESVGTGNINSPLQSINTANIKANLLEIPTIKVAARGNDKEYDETVSLIEGISIYGGYLADFSEAARDRDANKTIIKPSRSPFPPVFAKNIQEPTVISGFYIYSMESENTYAIMILDSSNELSIHNNYIQAGTSTLNTYSIYLDNSSPSITDNTITSLESNNDTHLIYMMNNSHPLVSGNTLSDGNSLNNVYGIYGNDNCNPEITGNTISLLNASALHYGVFIDTDCNPEITENTITSAQYVIVAKNNSNPFIQTNTLTANHTAIDFDNCCSFTVDDNDIMTDFTGIRIQNSLGTCTPVISNNTIIEKDDGYQVGIGNYSSSAVIYNNAINGAALAIGNINPSTPEIYDNTITVSYTLGSSNIGIANSDQVDANIYNNHIISENSSTYNYGIQCTNNSNGVILNNTIKTGSSGSSNTNAGIILLNNSSPEISGNIIISGKAINDISIGINCVYCASLIENNVILAGDTGSVNSSGIYIGGSSTPVIKNNTVSTRLQSAHIGCEVYSVNIFNGEPELYNNILFSLWSDTDDQIYGIYEQNNGASDPVTLSSNLIFNTYNGLYLDENTDAITDDGDGILNNGSNAEFDLLDGGTPVPNPNTGNITTSSSEDINDVFINGTYDPTDPTTWIILGNGLADLDNSGGWTIGDIGADVIHCGVQ